VAYLRRGTGRVMTRAPKRQTQWLAGTDPTAFTALAAATSVLFSSLNAAALALRPFTVVRVRGLLSIVSDQVAASESPFGAIGFAVVSDQAIAAGVGSVPTPTFENGSDLWFLHEYTATNQTFGSAIGFQEPAIQNVVLDSKAMRKVQEGQDIAIVLENGSALDGMLFLLQFRMLVKLH